MKLIQIETLYLNENDFHKHLSAVLATSYDLYNMQVIGHRIRMPIV
jgi:hypothetical protein